MARDQPPTLPPDPVIERYKRAVDQTLPRDNLKLSSNNDFVSFKASAVCRCAETSASIGQRITNFETLTRLLATV
jgi:hypothetical protein